MFGQAHRRTHAPLPLSLSSHEAVLERVAELKERTRKHEVNTTAHHQKKREKKNEITEATPKQIATNSNKQTTPIYRLTDPQKGGGVSLRALWPASSVSRESVHGWCWPATVKAARQTNEKNTLQEATALQRIVSLCMLNPPPPCSPRAGHDYTSLSRPIDSLCQRSVMFRVHVTAPLNMCVKVSKRECVCAAL